MMFVTIGKNCGWNWTYLEIESICCRYCDGFVHFAENHTNQSIFASIVKYELVIRIEIYKYSDADLNILNNCIFL